ncbi:unnamed protein product [Cylicostephanus goldi]|uniref:Uncharacterized protein n=1 Tax=Cylicostephanus goldi TaxID=71465 RepID=A0A3P6T616_CYLGO|nr:unnamed protein product [Cylicostephanus goldi]
MGPFSKAMKVRPICGAEPVHHSLQSKQLLQKHDDAGMEEKKRQLYTSQATNEFLAMSS